jgi:D-glycero-alpha-D-manno-heptose 1-phosphate guanylyltransferase
MTGIDTAIVLAGGLGTRLRAAVPYLPKPLAPVAGRPFLAWLLDRLAAEGIRHAVLAVGHQAEIVRDVMGARHGPVALAYSVETAPLGTGGALRRALATLPPGGPVLVVNGDTIAPVRLAALARAHRPPGLTLGLARVSDAARYGRVRYRHGRVTGFGTNARRGIPGAINAGAFLIDRHLLADAPNCFSFERDFLPDLLHRTRVAAVLDEGWFLDIGVPDDYHRAQIELPAHLLPCARPCSSTATAS